MGLKITEGYTDAPHAEDAKESALPAVDPARREWAAYRAVRDADPDWRPAPHKGAWEWGRTSWKVDGVQRESGALLWYTQPSNPHGGGGAASQSYEAFMRDGPFRSDIPDAILDQVYFLARNILESV